MTRLAWGTVGDRLFEAGVDRGVLYVEGQEGVAWNGLVSVSEVRSGGESKPYYVDGIVYMILTSDEQFEGTISAFYSPPEFDQCDGYAALQPGLYVTGQTRKPFGLSYRTMVGNDISGVDYAYKIHLIYDALASPAGRAYSTINNSQSAENLAWDITTMPVAVDGYKPSAHFIINTSEADLADVATLEDILYGSASTAPRLPSISEVKAIFGPNVVLTVTVNGDGTYTISGSDAVVSMLTSTTYQISAPSVVLVTAATYDVSSG